MISPSHIILFAIILLIVLLVFGASRLGDVGGSLGKSIREFRREVHSDDSDKTGDSTTSNT